MRLHLALVWCHMIDSVRLVVFFFQAEDGIRYLVRSRGLGDVYKRQAILLEVNVASCEENPIYPGPFDNSAYASGVAPSGCLLYTSDAADERSSVDLGGRRIIKKKKTRETAAQWCSSIWHNNRAKRTQSSQKQ